MQSMFGNDILYLSIAVYWRGVNGCAYDCCAGLTGRPQVPGPSQGGDKPPIRTNLRKPVSNPSQGGDKPPPLLWDDQDSPLRGLGGATEARPEVWAMLQPAFS